MYKIGALKDVSPQTCLALQGFSRQILQAGDLSPQDLMELPGNAYNGFVVEQLLNGMMVVSPWKAMLKE